MRKIAVFTGARSEYGILYPLIKLLHENDNCCLQLLVGGSHLSSEYGLTIQEIEKAPFPISETLDFLLASSSSVGNAKSMGLAIISTVDALHRLRPDILVLLGDRTETFAVAQAAMVLGIPIAHIHGGEVTEGAIDEVIRHALTKISHLHFTSTEEYRRRVIQLGEQPDRVFNVGAPGLDNIVELNLLDFNELNQQLPFELSERFVIVTYHPVTLASDGGMIEFKNLLEFLEKSDFQIVMTYPNSDTGSSEYISLIEEFGRKNSDRACLVQSLGQIRYLSLIKYCHAVVGNSSSGIIEAPSLGVPTINIGDRQKGRVRAGSVLSCDGSTESLRLCFSKVQESCFREYCTTIRNPYGNGGSSEQIVNVLCSLDCKKLLHKEFYDISYEISKNENKI